MKLVDWLLENHRRRLFFIFVILSILIIAEMYSSFILGQRISECSEIMDLLKITSETAVTDSFCGRLLINYLDLHTYRSLPYIIICSLSFRQIAIIILSIILYSENDFNERKRIRILCLSELLLSMTVLIWTAVMILFAASSTNAAMVADRLLLLSKGLKLISSGGMIFTVFLICYNGSAHYWKL